MERLTVEQFLFGGWDNPMRLPPLEGFHCIQGSRGSEAECAMSSFEEFKKTVRYLITDYAWDGRMTVDTFHDTKVQRFEMPDDDTIRSWYERERQEYDEIRAEAEAGL